MVATTLSGIELLGNLLLPISDKAPSDGGNHCFLHYWDLYFAAENPLYRGLGRAFRQLVRNREQARNVARRLAMIRYCEEVSGNVAKTCRYYGVSRPTYYKWLRRYEEHGIDGLRDTSSRRSPPQGRQQRATSLIPPQERG